MPEINNPGVFKRNKSDENISLSEGLPSISFSDPEDIADALRGGLKIENYRDFANRGLTKRIVNSFEGQKVNVNVDGQKIATSKLDVNDESASGFELMVQTFRNAAPGVSPIDQVIDGELMPEDSDLHNLRDLFSITGAETLSFSPVDNQASGRKFETKPVDLGDNMSGSMPSMGLQSGGLILAAGALIAVFVLGGDQ